MDLLSIPLFFLPNRVWRCYVGGLLLERFLGYPQPSDGHLPEEWLASTTKAENGARAQGPEEGLSRVKLPDGSWGPLLRDCLPGGVGVLCKFLDAAVRLPIQCHPNRAFARAHYRSPHGKTECWLVLATRCINGIAPYLLMGFKPGISAERFRAAVEKQDVAALENMLHRVPVKSGDCYLIPGRFPHAIGPGVFMLEVQEPSDWVVQVEMECAGTPLTANERWGPLAPHTALKCFSYKAEEYDAMRDRLAMRRQTLEDGATATREVLAAATANDCFRIERLSLRAAHSLLAPPCGHVGIVIAGHGTLEASGRLFSLQPGSVYYAAREVGEMLFQPFAPENLTLYFVMPLPAASGCA